jgi:hypothetical protein
MGDGSLHLWGGEVSTSEGVVVHDDGRKASLRGNTFIALNLIVRHACAGR